MPTEFWDPCSKPSDTNKISGLGTYLCWQEGFEPDGLGSRFSQDPCYSTQHSCEAEMPAADSGATLPEWPRNPRCRGMVHSVAACYFSFKSSAPSWIFSVCNKSPVRFPGAPRPPRTTTHQRTMSLQHLPTSHCASHWAQRLWGAKNTFLMANIIRIQMSLSKKKGRRWSLKHKIWIYFNGF